MKGSDKCDLRHQYSPLLVTSRTKRTSHRLPLAAVLAMTAGLAACTDSTAPTHSLRSGYLTSSTAVLSNTTIDFKALYPKLSKQVPSLTMKGDAALQKFTVNPPDGKLIEFGKTTGHVIAIPANTLCDPTKNVYGPWEWLKPCVLAKSSISFEVRTWTDALGQPHADFNPDIRFNPSAPAPVRLYFKQPLLTAFSTVYIPFCNASNVCVNEGASDPAQQTYVSPLSGGGYWVYRMLRHFSGYNVTAF
jgi:hypothetical protein